ncbi:MAG TPA: FAD-dependent thymidylate synthase [Gaiellaceae bacterium]|nr:FAD-dependent thymidylate synthase [Gaiellaceae bacterium]
MTTSERIDLLDHGFVRLDDAMASDLSVVNAARVSFARRKEAMDEADEGLVGFLMRDRHGSPFEHNAFRFHVRSPIFVAREWFRHRIGCLTGETDVVFVDVNGSTSPRLRKTIEELWLMWSRGERDGHALPEETRLEVRRLLAEGLSQRAIARRLGIGRRAVRSVIVGADGYRSGRARVRRMRLRVLDEATGEFTVGHVCDVIDKGVQPVYRLTLADGKQLTLTENHRLLTGEGWQTMRAAVGLVGDGSDASMTRSCALLTNGVPAHRNPEWLAERRREGRSVAEMAAEAGCSYHTIRKWLARYDLGFTREDRLGRRPWNAGLRGYRTSLRTTDAHRDAIRRARSGPRSNFWRGGITSERASIGRWTREQAPRVHASFDYTCQACGRCGGALHVHHVVPVWRDETLARELGNLVSVCDECHRCIHRTRATELTFGRQHGIVHIAELPEPPVRGWKLTAHPVSVVAVEYVGLRQTYDLSVEGPWHNFVGDGVVVHNSFNEFSMRYAKATDDFYVPAAEDVRSQVGKPGAYTFEPVDAELAERTREELAAVYETAYATYTRLVEAGVAREVARSALPVGAYTEFYWTVNARALMNFLSLRNAETAQREIRRYAEAVETLFAERMPVTHAAFVAGGRVSP